MVGDKFLGALFAKKIQTKLVPKVFSIGDKKEEKLKLSKNCKKNLEKLKKTDEKMTEKN